MLQHRPGLWRPCTGMWKHCRHLLKTTITLFYITNFKSQTSVSFIRILMMEQYSSKVTALNLLFANKLSTLDCPAFSIPANWCHIFQACIFHPCSLVPHFPVPQFLPLHFWPSSIFWSHKTDQHAEWPLPSRRLLWTDTHPTNRKMNGSQLRWSTLF